MLVEVTILSTLRYICRSWESIVVPYAGCDFTVHIVPTDFGHQIYGNDFPVETLVYAAKEGRKNTPKNIFVAVSNEMSALFRPIAALYPIAAFMDRDPDLDPVHAEFDFINGNPDLISIEEEIAYPEMRISHMNALIDCELAKFQRDDHSYDPGRLKKLRHSLESYLFRLHNEVELQAV